MKFARAKIHVDGMLDKGPHRSPPQTNYPILFILKFLNRLCFLCKTSAKILGVT